MSLSLLRSQHPLLAPAFDLLFPPACTICQKALTQLNPEPVKPNGLPPKNTQILRHLTQKLLCKRCLKELLVNRILYEIEPHCACCGRFCKTTRDTPLCLLCQENRAYKNLRIRSIFYYQEAARSLIHNMKYQQKTEIANLISLMLITALPALFLPGSAYYAKELSGAQLGWDTICYIPSYKGNIVKRGFYSTHFIARKLSKILNIPLLEIRLETIKNTGTPRSLLPKGKKETQEIPHFKTQLKTDKRSEISRILLLDDVITTGASLQGALLALGSQQIQKIDVVSIAQSKHLHRYLFK